MTDKGESIRDFSIRKARENLRDHPRIAAAYAKALGRSMPAGDPCPFDAVSEAQLVADFMEGRNAVWLPVDAFTRETADVSPPQPDIGTVPRKPGAGATFADRSQPPEKE